MAIYYVRNDGSNANAGTGPATNQAWQTVTYALANMVLTTGTNYLYIAPGAYREAPTVTITPSSTQTLVISGDPTASQFSGLTAGIVRLTNFTSDTANPSNANILTISGKTYITITGLHFDIFTSSTNYAIQGATSPDNIIIEKCTFQAHDNGGFAAYGINFVHTSIVQNITIQKCVFNRCYVAVAFESSASAGTSQQFTSTDCLFIGCDIGCFYITGNGINRKIINCTFVNWVRTAVNVQSAQAGGTSVTNCFFSGGGTAVSTNSVGITENYNRFISCTPRNNVSPSGANSVTGGIAGLDIGYALITGMVNQQMFSTLLGSPNTAFGTSTGAPASDMYGVTWTGATPDAGSATFRTLSNIGSYLPTERNASAITVAPGSTSQSIELYLGATGLTFATSGLAAYYVRNQSAPVAITLVTQTPTGAWASGGFAEISSSLVPGVYRLDVPNAAFAAGASDVTIVVRGASGTNGAVLTVTLSSGGLTAAQTAAAIFNAATTDYTANGTYGLNLLRADQQNKQGLVTLHSSGGINRVDADVHAIQNDAAAATYLKGALLHDGTGYVDADVVRVSTSIAAANELEGALLHNGTDYISADLLTPVSAATSVHIGPYQLLADGLGADQPLDVNVGTATSIDVQVTDANGTGIDITGATTSAKVYSSAGTLVATYSGTATYADNGRLTFGLTTTVTNTSGTYTVTVTRTTGATDTQIFGPLRLYVRPV